MYEIVAKWTLSLTIHHLHVWIWHPIPWVVNTTTHIVVITLLSAANLKGTVIHFCYFFHIQASHKTISVKWLSSLIINSGYNIFHNNFHTHRERPHAETDTKSQPDSIQIGSMFQLLLSSSFSSQLLLFFVSILFHHFILSYLNIFTYINSSTFICTFACSCKDEFGARALSNFIVKLIFSLSLLVILFYFSYSKAAVFGSVASFHKINTL